MSVIIIRPKNKTERDFLTRLFKKMNIEVQLMEEMIPNQETHEAMQDVENRKGTRVRNSRELFTKLGI